MIADPHVILGCRPIPLGRPLPAAKGLGRIDGDADAVLIADPQTDQSRRIALVRRTSIPLDRLDWVGLDADPVLVAQADRVLRNGQSLPGGAKITVQSETFIFLDAEAQVVTTPHQPLAHRLPGVGGSFPRSETFLVDTPKVLLGTLAEPNERLDCLQVRRTTVVHRESPM